MPIYIERSDGAYLRYEGMTEIEIAAMLEEQGFTYQLITAEQFNAQEKS